MPKISISQLPVKKGEDSVGYPAPYDQGCGKYRATALGDAVGLTQFGVYIETLLPGGMSSQRHWHSSEDEFLYILSGEAILVENDGEHVLKAGDAAGWKAGDPNAHHLFNRTQDPVSYILVGTRATADEVTYPDIDLHYCRKNGERKFTRKDGQAYEQNTTGTTGVPVT